MADWAEIMPVQIGKVLDRDGVAVHVAHNPGETDRSMDLHGWIATEREYLVSVKGKLTDPRCPLVHYVYVKQPYRPKTFHVATALIKALGWSEGEPLVCTAWTEPCEWVRPGALVYKPSLLGDWRV